MPSTEPRIERDKSRQVPMPSTFSTLAPLDPFKPCMESTSGRARRPHWTSGHVEEDGVDKRTGITIEYLAVVMRRYQRGKAYLVAFHGRDYARSALARWSLAAGVKGEAIVGGAVENKQWSRAQRRWAREKLAADPFSWYLTHGGFYLLDQRRKRICLQDLSHHNCIEHNTSLVHPDFEFRDEYAPIEMHLHMLENLMRYSKGGFIMTSNDVARVQVARKAEYTFLMDKMHVEIGRGKMAVVLQLFNNLENYAPSSPSPHSPATHICRLIPSPLPSPSPPPPVSLPGVPNHMLCVFMLKSSSPMAGRPTTASGSCTPCAWPRVFADPYARSSNKTADRKAGRTRAKTIDKTGGAGVVIEMGNIGGEPLDEPAFSEACR
ncbi:uncharacterized protein C8Q71DRAFT_869085 [Rhodofomes roseus]|uniref:Heme haloperoxidase family profile domain-containing protein n=1 Tax=Rhodofomes roseus TaxID=34475 RepID=A0ABQ8KDA5_9APHY|nr:uncharacterized protein C8Q71DRAFT_869085 [Rhodofomes roseus]KAH9835532.1 hypothetical protein C8Q71DRAFT_869085 [Rhodofomes roseus]